MATVQEYLDTYSSRSTKRNYRIGICAFLRFIYNLPEEGRERTERAGCSAYELYAARYLSENRDRINDLTRFIVSTVDRPATTRRAYKTAVIGWFAANKIFLNDHEKRTTRNKIKGDVATQDAILSRKILARLLAHSPLIIKTLILVLSSSGMRIGEALQLKWRDVELDRDPVRVRIRANYTKTNKARTVYVSREAKEALLEWRASYEDYLEQREKYANLKKPLPAGDRIFPVDQSRIQRLFQGASQKAGLDERDPTTKRYLVHIHGMRKYFRSVLPKGGNENALDYVEELLGHSGYLTKAYRRISEEEIEAFYKEAEHVLWVQQPVQVSTAELKAIQDENKQLKVELETMKTDNQKIMAMLQDVIKNLPLLSQ